MILHFNKIPKIQFIKYHACMLRILLFDKEFHLYPKSSHLLNFILTYIYKY